MKKRTQGKKIRKVVAEFMSVLLLLAMLPAQVAEAASATITLSGGTTEIHVGDRVEVRLTISADTTIGDVEAFLSYDDTIFEFYSAAACITGGAGFLKVSDIGASPSAQDRTYRLYFNAKAPGECEVALSERPVIYSYTDGTELSVTAVSKTFSVLPSASASDNSSLSALYLVEEYGTAVTLTPDFSSEQLTYKATIPEKSDMVIVSAIAADASANVEVTGGRDLVLGNNEVQVIVTAESGSATVYTIEVCRLEQSDEPEITPVPGNPEEATETGVIVTTQGEQVWLTEHHTYTIEKVTEEMVIPGEYVPTVVMIGDVQVPAYVKQGDSASEFVVLVLKNDSGDVHFYRYDRAEQTLQRLSEEDYVINQSTPNEREELQSLIEQYEFHQSLLSLLVVILIVICMLLLGIIIWLSIRRKNRG